jgi:hypothetical protein
VVRPIAKNLPFVKVSVRVHVADDRTYACSTVLPPRRCSSGSRNKEMERSHKWKVEPIPDRRLVVSSASSMVIDGSYGGEGGKGARTLWR